MVLREKGMMACLISTISFISALSIMPLDQASAMDRPITLRKEQGYKTHMAIKDEGYFIVSDTLDENPNPLSFTKLGTFDADENGFFRNTDGQFLKIVPVDRNESSLPPCLT